MLRYAPYYIICYAIVFYAAVCYAMLRCGTHLGCARAMLGWAKVRDALALCYDALLLCLLLVLVLVLVLAFVLHQTPSFICTF